MKNHQIFVLVFIIGLRLFGGVPDVYPQDYSSLILSFTEKSIPVDEIQLKDKTVVARVRYKVGDDVSAQKQEQDLSFLFTALAAKFPSSETIVLKIFAETLAVSELEMATSDALAAHQGTLSLTKIMSKIRMEPQFDIEKSLSSELKIKAELAEKEEPPAPLLPEKIAAIPDEEKRPRTSEENFRGGPAGGGSGVFSSGRTNWLLIILTILLILNIALFAAIVSFRTRKAKPPLRISARIDIFYSDGGRKSFFIQSPRTTIGRASDNSLVINDSQVSGRHAEIIISQDGFLVRDLGSTNGTVLNGRKISEGPIYLHDEIVVGSTKLILGE